MTKYSQRQGGLRMERKSYQIEYLPTFYKQFNKIICYIRYKLKNPIAANNLIDKVEQAIIERSFNPEAYESFRSSKPRKYLWYRIYIDNYTIFYTVVGNKMSVAKIIYTKRDLQTII